MTQLESDKLLPVPVTPVAQCDGLSTGVSTGGSLSEVESEDMERGWFKVWRKLQDSQVWSHSVNMRSVWITLLMRANHTDAYFKGSKVRRGQLVASWNTLASDSLLTVEQTRYCVKFLEDWKKIRREVTGNYQVLTICKYDAYQNGSREKSQPSNSVVPDLSQPSHRPVTTSKNEEKDKKEKNETKQFSQPSEQEVSARFNELGWDKKRSDWEAPQFVAHHSARGWMLGRSKMKSWQAACVTWKANNFGEAKYSATTGKPPDRPPTMFELKSKAEALEKQLKSAEHTKPELACELKRKIREVVAQQAAFGDQPKEAANGG